MASFEDELLQDAELDAQEVAYIHEHLSHEASERLTEEDLYYLIDVISSYYAESGVLDAEPDKDGCIDLPIDSIVEHVQAAAKKELGRTFDADDLAEVLDADLDFAFEDEE